MVNAHRRSKAAQDESRSYSRATTLSEPSTLLLAALEEVQQRGVRIEKDRDNVRRAVTELKINYPVALDNDYKIWKAFNNSYWPADYLVDATGHIRFHHFGEGKYDESEQQIQQLLKEHDGQLSLNGLVKVAATGAEAPPAVDVESPESISGG